MNLVGGFGRIALVIALVITIPGFLFGGKVARINFETISHEYQAWLDRYNQKRIEIEEEADALSESELISRVKALQPKSKLTGLNPPLPHDPRRYYIDRKLSLHRAWHPPPPQYQVSPLHLMIGGGLLGALVSFFIVFSLLKGLIHGVNWFARRFSAPV